ncbi:hypothetical protein GF342_02930 [Candidatus Woesearchaeota archaeon]|nr:hypothetical protein [Candidatus Woesearchaeota archaeon]
MIAQLFATARQFFIYCVGGGIAAITNWSITVFLTEVLLLWYLVSYSLATIISVAVNFLYQRKVTFGVGDRVRSRLIKFSIIMAVTASLNVASVFFLTEYLHIFYFISIVVVTFIMAMLNYIGNRFWTFRN